MSSNQNNTVTIEEDEIISPFLFTPKNGKFVAYTEKQGIEVPELTAQEFTEVIFARSYNEFHNSDNTGGEKATNALIAQIDADDPNVFTLMMVPYKEWHKHMLNLGFDSDLLKIVPKEDEATA